MNQLKHVLNTLTLMFIGLPSSASSNKGFVVAHVQGSHLYVCP